MRRTLSALCLVLLLLPGFARAEAPALAVETDEAGRAYLVLFNPGPDSLENVLLRERDTGRGRVLRFAAPGETYVYWPSQAGSAGARVFEAVLEDGAVLTAQGRVGGAEAPDQPAPNVPAPEGASMRMRDAAATFRSMIAGGALALLAVIAVWRIDDRRRRRQERRQRLRARQEKKKRLRRNGEKTA